VKRLCQAVAILSVATAALAAEPQESSSDSINTSFRVFDGTNEVSAETRIHLRRSDAAEDDKDGVQLNGPALAIALAPGIYDAQAIRHRGERVLSVRWAERLVIVRYPDEAGEHLEVINFASNFGALQLRLPPNLKPDPSALTVDRHGTGGDTRQVRVLTGPDYLLVVAPAGVYDVRWTHPEEPEFVSSVEIPADRTRMLAVAGPASP
jgi:hypothetical protein